MQHRLLFVCTANVCRSPLIAETFASLGVPAGVRIRSAGTGAGEGRSMCVVAGALVADAHRVDAHRSVNVSAADLDHQDLIVTASRAERADLARRSPGTRRRTFTLNEIVRLGEQPFTDAEIARARSTESSVLRAYVWLLDSRRGLVFPEPAKRRLRRRVADPLDVPDVHHLRTSAHERTLAQARATTGKLYAQLLPQLAPPVRVKLRSA